MPTADQIRITRSRLSPRILKLWQALRPLTSVVRLMNSGAHPDDETSALLAALGLRDGINLSIACANRGEGGQNDIGTQATAALGALRTREMEAAAEILDARLYWLSQSPRDPIFDFGFSKSGTETFRHWSHARTLQRLVEIVRREQPDILLPTFLDVPGQHGHHRAMTQAAVEVMSAAADPDIATPGLAPWQIAKLYLPAWSGAGQAYDDDLPPPPQTVLVTGTGRDPVSGWTYAAIGQQSRSFHRTQGMGHWAAAGSERDYPLHLAQSHVTGPDETLTTGLPRTLADLGRQASGAESAHLISAQAHIDAAIQAFPDPEAIRTEALAALARLRAAMGQPPVTAPPGLLSRLSQKEAQLIRVIRLTSGVDLTVSGTPAFLRAGQSIRPDIALDPGCLPRRGATTLHWDLPPGWTAGDEGLTPGVASEPTDAYVDTWDPLDPPRPRARLTSTLAGQSLSFVEPFDTPPVLLPAVSATLAPRTCVVNRARGLGMIQVTLTDLHPTDGTADLHLPPGWQATRNSRGFAVTPPPDTATGSYTLSLSINGEPAPSVTPITTDHTAPTALCEPAEVRVAVVDVALPEAQVGYIGGGNDAVADWLAALGADVTALGDADLTSPEALAAYDTLVIGIFAFRHRPGLAEAASHLHDWTRAGGNLVTLYHRPWDNWDPEATPPLRLEIGQPSLRWRVTDAEAAVTVLAPDHPALTTPNAITADDWTGWHKERGLYFAKSWDAAYTPLLSMSDPGEDPLTGSLLSAPVGAGRHIHCALILHHQMAHLVPGAFRLMANLITPPPAAP